MLTVQFYTREQCSLCHSALAVVQRVQNRIPFHLEIIDIDPNPALAERFGAVIPVVTCENLELARSFVDEKSLLQAIQKIAPKQA